MPKVFDLRRYEEHSVKNKNPDALTVLSCLTWVPDVIGKTKEEIDKIPYMDHADMLLDEWFSEKEEEHNGTSQHSTLQN